MRLRERARDDEVRVARGPCDGIGLFRWLEKFVVRLVENDQHVLRDAGDERFDHRTREPGSRRIVRIRDEHDARLRRHRGAHRVEVVAVILRRHFDAERAARLRGERIDDERVLRIDGVIAPAQEGVRRELEHVVAAVAEHDPFPRHAKSSGERRLERMTVAVGITGDFGCRFRNRGERPRAWAARILVRRELHDRRRVERQLARDLLDGLAPHVRRDRAHVFRCAIGGGHRLI